MTTKTKRNVISSDPRLYHWLQKRRIIAEDLFERRRISQEELTRVVVDASMGQYTGPMQFRDGTPSKEADKVRSILAEWP